MSMYCGEELFDYILIRETGEFDNSGYKTGYLFGVNYDNEDKLIPLGIKDSFSVSPSCKFDFHDKGGISVFSKDFGPNPKMRKVFVLSGYHARIIAYKDCSHVV